MKRNFVLLCYVVQFFNLCIINHLLPLHILHSGVPDLGQKLGKLVDVGLDLGPLLHLLRRPLAVLTARLGLGEQRGVELGQGLALGHEESLRPLLQRAPALEAQRDQGRLQPRR